MFETLIQIGMWIGWFPTFVLSFLIGIVGYWVLTQRVKSLQDDIRNLEKFTPDVVAKRLSERHKHQQEALELLSEDREKNEKRIFELENEISETRSEMIKLEKQYSSAMTYLQGTLPREGIVLPSLEEAFYTEIRESGKLVLNIHYVGKKHKIEEFVNKINSQDHYFLYVEPNMGKLHFSITTGSEDIEGFAEIENPIDGIYDKDYKVTLLKVLGTYFHGHTGEPGLGIPPSMKFPDSSKFYLSGTITPAIKFEIPIDPDKTIYTN